MSVTRIVVDAMGGDNAPGEIIKGALEALPLYPDAHIILSGRREAVEAGLSGKSYPSDRLEILDAPEVIETGEPPVKAVRTKKESSLVKGLMMVRGGEADAFITAGSSGATLVGGQVIVGRIRGIERPPFAPIIPTATGPALLIDCGANVDARASHLVQFAQMGSIYMENVVGIRRPRVALLNIGAEEEKGNALIKETMPLLRELTNINFIGNIEARDIPAGGADVVVSDAFAGNIALKMYEGVAATLLSEIKKGMTSTLRAKIGALLVKPALKETLKSFDASAYGGAPMLGLTGLVVKTHGNAKANEIRNAVGQCIEWKDKAINDRFVEEMGLKK